MVFSESETFVHVPNIFPCTHVKHNDTAYYKQNMEGMNNLTVPHGEKVSPYLCLPLSRSILTMPKTKAAIAMRASLEPPQKKSITSSLLWTEFRKCL